MLQPSDIELAALLSTTQPEAKRDVLRRQSEQHPAKEKRKMHTMKNAVAPSDASAYAPELLYGL